MSETKRQRHKQSFAQPPDFKRVKRGVVRLTLLPLLGLTVCTTLVASGEEVVIRTVVHDKAILVRNSHELYMIQTTTHCRSLSRFHGKTVFLLYAPNHSLGPGSHLLLRNPHRRCSILYSFALDGVSDSKARATVKKQVRCER